MRLYPDVPDRRTRTIALDAAVVAGVVLFAWLGLRVHDRVKDITAVSAGVQRVGGQVQGALNDAGNAVGGTPVVGGQVRDALQGAAKNTGGEAVRAGRDGERSILQLAKLLGWLTFLVPTLLLLSRAVPPRIGQIRKLTAAERVLDEPDDPDRRRLLAQRAAYGLPYATLLRHTPDPIGDLHAGRFDALVAAVREDAGLRARP